VLAVLAVQPAELAVLAVQPAELAVPVAPESLPHRTRIAKRTLSAAEVPA